MATLLLLLIPAYAFILAFDTPDLYHFCSVLFTRSRYLGYYMHHVTIALKDTDCLIPHLTAEQSSECHTPFLLWSVHPRDPCD